MMPTRKLVPAFLLAVTAAVSWPTNAPTGAAGPGAVVEAVRQLLAAQSASDTAALKKVLDTTGDHLYGFDSDSEGKLAEVTENTPMAFYDVAGDGKPVAGGDQAAAVKVLLHGGKRTLRAIRANCHSAECSIATCEFDATHGEGDKVVTTRMRATALLRYDEKMPGFRIFHWHASPAAR